jgi:hypothetical protein
MKNDKEWETRSLEWIHKVRADLEQEITGEGISISQWMRARGEVDDEKICKRLGLKNLKIVKGKRKTSQEDHPPTSVGV